MSVAWLTKSKKYDTISKGVWRNGNARGFDPCIRQFDPANPCHAPLAQWLVRAPYKRVIMVRFHD